MISSILKTYSNFLKVLTSDFDTPFINLQPTIYMPTLNPNGTLSQTKTSLGKTVNVLLGMEFSINYFNPNSTTRDSIEHKFELSKSIVTLKKFVKKNGLFETYQPQLHKPQTLFVTDNNKTIADFEVFVADGTIKNIHGELNPGSQLCAIAASTKGEMKLSAMNVRRATKNFQGLLKMKDESDFVFYAYQFCVETPYTKEAAELSGQEKLVLKTNMFKIFLDDDKFTLKTEEVDACWYHQSDYSACCCSSNPTRETLV